MSILAALADAYVGLRDRGEAPPFGYSSEKIAFVIALDTDGRPVGVPTDLRAKEGKKLVTPLMTVPQPPKRASGIAPNFLWDKTAYVLGVTAAEGRRTADENAAFRAFHRKVLDGSEDAGLQALLKFIQNWTPDDFDRLGWPPEMKDQNVVFSLEVDRLSNIRIHDRPAARTIWSNVKAAAERGSAVCLVSGAKAPVARLHPSIKGVWGAQSAGASIVSFNLDAFESYGHEQGDNAPVSEAAAFAYTTALNRFLERGSRHRIQIGDASTVFWADASKAAAASTELLFGGLLGELPDDPAIDRDKLLAQLERVRAGRPLAEIDPGLEEGVRFFVLGLSPNAARLSIRFWLEDDFAAIARRFAAHAAAMRIEPPPRDPHPPIWRCLVELAAQRKPENVPPNLAGDWLRAILSGFPYPYTLLATLLMRLRTDGDVNPIRVAMIRATLVSRGEEIPVSLDMENRDPGYLLGRLFAALEHAQQRALGRPINATIRDKFYGAASASPRAVFPLLLRTSTHHLAQVRKKRPNLAERLDRQIAAIFELADADRLLVPTLAAQQQAMFAIGYYHQKSALNPHWESSSSEDPSAASTEETDQ